jgi:hypothetical protein
MLGVAFFIVMLLRFTVQKCVWGGRGGMCVYGGV